MAWTDFFGAATNVTDTFAQQGNDRGTPELGQTGEGGRGSVFDTVLGIASKGVEIWRAVDPAKEADKIIAAKTADQKTVNPGSNPTVLPPKSSSVPDWVWGAALAGVVTFLMTRK
jgi:hypothetical protein